MRSGRVALAVSAAAKDKEIVLNPGSQVEFFATVTAVHQVTAGNSLRGLHFAAKVKAQTFDVYLAPTDFAVRYDVKVAKGEYPRVVGTQEKLGGADVVLAREITKGLFNPRTGAFRPNLTVYLRNDEGPLW